MYAETDESNIVKFLLVKRMDYLLSKIIQEDAHSPGVEACQL